MSSALSVLHQELFLLCHLAMYSIYSVKVRLRRTFTFTHDLENTWLLITLENVTVLLVRSGVVTILSPC